MKVRMLFIGAVVSVALVGSAFGWGIPSIGGGGSSKSAGDPDAFLAKSQESEKLVNNSANLLFGLVASKEAQAKIEALQQKIAATTNADEKKSLIQEKSSSQLNEISKASANKALEAEAKKWDAKKKGQAKDAVFNLALGAKMASELVPEGQNISKSVQSNPMMATKLGSITDALKSLGGIISGSGKVLTALPPVLTAAKVDVELPKTSTDKPKPMADIPD
jgi:hypothetical protein